VKTRRAALRYFSAQMTACPDRCGSFPSLLWLCLLAACEPTVRHRPIAFEEEGRASATATVPLGQFKRFGEIDALPAVSKLRSGHPVGSLAGVVKVDAAAGGYGQRGRGPFPVGALVVESLGPDPDGPANLFYVMEKREVGFFPLGGDWQYSVVSASGALEAQGKLALCARCHAEAPRDHLFEFGAAKSAKQPLAEPSKPAGPAPATQ
jgi:hypothetical protein